MDVGFLASIDDWGLPVFQLKLGFFDTPTRVTSKYWLGGEVILGRQRNLPFRRTRLCGVWRGRAPGRRRNNVRYRRVQCTHTYV